MLYEEALTEQIIGALIEVHRVLGPGLLESAYQACAAREFFLRQMVFEQEKTLALGIQGCPCRLRIPLGFHRCGESRR